MIDKNADERDSFNAHPDTKKLVKICGEIKNYSQSRKDAIFFFTKNDKFSMEVIAVLASLAVLGGQATAISSNAHSLEETADYVEFEIDDKRIKGWLWRSPFSNNDSVHVATEWNGEYYELFGACRPEDRTIALYPHCSRGKLTHIRNAIKWWLVILVLFNLLMLLVPYIDDYSITAAAKEMIDMYGGENGWAWLVGTTAIVTVPVVSMTMKWMPFVKVAENVFKTLELPNSANIDLVRSSKKQRTNEDQREFGSMYFRY